MPGIDGRLANHDLLATVDRYIVAGPEQAHKAARPEGTSERSRPQRKRSDQVRSVPSLKMNGILFSYFAHKTHLNFMPTRTTVEQFKSELKN